MVVSLPELCRMTFEFFIFTRECRVPCSGTDIQLSFKFPLGFNSKYVSLGSCSDTLLRRSR